MLSLTRPHPVVVDVTLRDEIIKWFSMECEESRGKGIQLKV